LHDGLQDADLSMLVLLEELSRGGVATTDAVAAAKERAGGDVTRLEAFVAALEASDLVIEHGHGDEAQPLPRSPSSTDVPRPLSTSPLTIPAATTLVLEAGRFLWFDHSGSPKASLCAEEVDALRSFLPARTPDDAYGEYRQRTSGRLLDRGQFFHLAERLFARGLLAPPRATRSDRGDPASLISSSEAAAIRANVAAAVEARSSANGGDARRMAVIPVNTVSGVRPLALGLLLAHASQLDRGRLRERYDFVPLFLCDAATLEEFARTPSIFLFSNYVWNFEENLALSALVKRLHPESITIHGGPSTPKYEEDAQDFFAAHPHVDVAVRGEGEATFAALLDALDGSRDWRAVADVKGLTFRDGTRLVRTPDRERIGALDTIPSPYLLGLFEPFGTGSGGAVIETNRGCPFGCTFCDWGSATLSKIRPFSLDRVFAELEWSASHGIDVCAIADANFGTFERDVVIAEKIADLKRRYGYPRTVATNYAKNTVKHLRKIIEILAREEILTEGLVALQSTDAPTLKTIRRSNIKSETYDTLAGEFRRSGLPLVAEIMMGLPGATPDAFHNDLQTCIDRDVKARVHPTQLLPNSPMNDPVYRREHGIVARPGEILVETSTYTRSQWDEMESLRQAYELFDTWGILRYVAMFVRSELRVREVDFYDRLQRDVRSRPERWPLLWSVMRAMERLMAPPGSWGLFLAEVRRYLIGEMNVADDDVVDTVLRVQLAHLPAPERPFPETIHLPHDFVSWQRAIHEARESGHRSDWEAVVPSLRTYPGGDLTVDDPYDVSLLDVGRGMGYLAFALQSWELDSPVARPAMRYLTRFATVPSSEEMSAVQ
jgi:radical SAM superfamily enzyme YgiQ (UPF0313 family)